MTAGTYHPEEAVGAGSEEKGIGVHQEARDAEMAMAAERGGTLAEGDLRRVSLLESKARSHSGRRPPNFRAASATPKAAVAAGAIAGILLISLVTSRLIFCLQAAIPRRTTRRAINSGATERRLAEGEKPLLSSADESAAPGLREATACFDNLAFSLADEGTPSTHGDIASVETSTGSSLNNPSTFEMEDSSPRLPADDQLTWGPLMARAGKAVLVLTLSLTAGFFLGLYAANQNRYFLFPVVGLTIAMLILLRQRRKLVSPSVGGRLGPLETVETRF